MRTLLWTCTLTFVFVPLAFAQDLAQLRAAIEANVPTRSVLNELGPKPPTQESVDASKAVFEAATKIYALPDLPAAELQWTLQREAAALIVLAYTESKYYSRLARVSDELEAKGLGNSNIAKEAEKHVLEIGGALATAAGNNAMGNNIGPLSERMVMYAEQYPGPESFQVIERFLQRIRLMKNAAHRDRRLAVAAPIFQKYYQKANHSARASALDPDISRSTLHGQPMLLMGVDINGKDLDRQSLNDKVVLLQFWGTWCVHCKEEMPGLIALYSKYRDSGFEIIGVNTGAKGDSPEKVKQFVDAPLPDGNRIPWTILHEGLSERKHKGFSMTKFYGIDELPVMILIGRNGKVLDLHPLFSTLEARIAEVTSLVFAVESELTDEEKEASEDARKKRREEEDRRISKELSNP